MKNMFLFSLLLGVSAAQSIKNLRFSIKERSKTPSLPFSVTLSINSAVKPGIASLNAGEGMPSETGQLASWQPPISSEEYLNSEQVSISGVFLCSSPQCACKKVMTSKICFVPLEAFGSRL
ncbi:hypothetical protein AVEN_190614-1 [Araneus ventricosus]|uniref:Secreted protein n=1 Tax=Araneus ventricosus TaxID=182803 RepID=A0A4Y2CD74_ARAVE|nr:hypothetical protein AVEN_190614-1 [Araneus ventricosus]